LAARYLMRFGWSVVARNWRCRDGELDLICREPDGTVVVCEVKSRTGRGYGTPLEAITQEKARRLRRLTAAWAREQAAPIHTLRIDAVGVLWHPDGTASVTHERGIAR
jgi:putative endonuclease